MTDETEPTPEAFKLGETPDIGDAEKWLELARKSSKDQELVIDASDVTEMNSALLFAVASSARSFSEAGGKIAILTPSAAFVDAFSDLGLFQDLMKMEFRQ